ncbi:hypothetical protein ABPG74_021831 [Tetrahymena malaccensis]
MFQQSYSFQFGKSNIQNSTFFGGFLTALITILATVYLGYMLNLYFDNKLLPKVTFLSQTYQNQQEISLIFEQSPILFQFMLNGQLIDDFQDMTGKIYFKFDVYYVESFQNYTNEYILPIQDCSNVYNSMEGLKCIDFENANDQIKQLILSDDRQASYEIRISSCDGISNCSSKEETMNVLTNQNTQLSLIINTQQFNYTSRQFQQSFQQENYSFDDHLVFNSAYHLKKTTTNISKGLIFQDRQQKDHLANYQRQDFYISNNNIKYKAGYGAYGLIQFLVDQNFQQQEFQYPMITEILSQFFSLVNVLVALGVVASQFSKKLILSNLSVLYLKEQFKCTAANLIQRKQKYSPANIKTNSFTDEVIGLQEKISQTDFLDRDKHLSIYQKFKQEILKIFRINSKNTDQESQDILNKKLMDYTLEQLDILQLYKQLIKLNMAIKLILTKDQYAALQFCGCNFDSQADILQFKSILEVQKKSQIEQKQDQPNQSNINTNQNQNNIQNQKQNQELLSDLCISPQKQETNLLKDNPKQSSNQTSQLNLSILNNHNSQKEYFNINFENKNNELTSNQFDKSVDQEDQLLESDLFSFQKENYSQIQTRTNNYQLKQIGMLNNQMEIKNTGQKPATIMKLNFLKSYTKSRDQQFKGDQSIQTHEEQDKVTVGKNIDQNSQLSQEQTIQDRKQNLNNQTLDDNQFNNIEKKIDPSNLNKQEQQIINEVVKQIYNKNQNEQAKINQNYIQKQTNNLSKEIYQNHIEELNRLDKDQILLKQEFFNFISKFKSNNTTISEIDKNIQNSLIINYNSHKL